MNTIQTEEDLFNFIFNFKPTEIPPETHFWMVRTKKGYFYHEFVQKKFVALAWNTITNTTDFSDTNSETLCDSILVDYPQIKRPKLVVNKCKSFISEIKPNDILVIPSNSSKYITFAYAGDYYEEESKTPEIEKNIIQRIEHGEVVIDEVNCPYRKRRHITPIRTIKIEELNYHLYKALSSYHGISNLDDYGTVILDHLFNCYTFKNEIRLVFHVGKPDAITSKEFSGFLYSINSILTCTGIQESDISTQASVHSIGDIVFTIIKESYDWLSNNYMFFIAIASLLGGGSFFTVKLPGLPTIIKDFLSIKTARDISKAELTDKKLEQCKKTLEIKKQMDELGMTLEDFQLYMEKLASSSTSMQIQPIETIDEPSISDADDVQTDNEEERL